MPPGCTVVIHADHITPVNPQLFPAAVFHFEIDVLSKPIPNEMETKMNVAFSKTHLLLDYI